MEPVGVGDRRRDRPEDVRRAVLPPRVGLPGHLLPRRRVRLEPGLEERILLAGARQHRDEAAPMLVDVLERLARAELAVRDIEEVRRAHQGAKHLPCLAVGGAVFRVAVGHLDVDGDGAVGAHREDPEELFEIGPMVLIVAERHDQRGPAPDQAAGGLGVLAVERQARGVVVQLLQRDRELLDHVHHEGGQQRVRVGIEQSIQGSAHAIVVEESDLLRAQSQEGGDPPPRPFPQPVERHAGQHEIAREDTESGTRRQLRAGVGRRQVARQELLESQAPQDVVHEGQAAEGVRDEREAAGLSHPRVLRRRKLTARGLTVYIPQEPCAAKQICLSRQPIPSCSGTRLSFGPSVPNSRSSGSSARARSFNAA